MHEPLQSARLSDAHQNPTFAADTHSLSSRRLNTLTTSALFAGLTRRDCIRVASYAMMRHFSYDKFLFIQGQAGNDFAMVHKGSVKLSQLCPNGNEVILWMAGPGELVGHPPFLSGGTRTCSARAMEQCEVLVWEHSRLQSLFEEIPQMIHNVGQIVSDRLVELQERFREVATEKVDARVALTLLRLLRTVGRPSRGGIEVLISRDELAQMTGAVECTVSRLLSKWEREGLVLSRRQSIIVLDAFRLSRNQIRR